jgi:hypothetical protein
MPSLGQIAENHVVLLIEGETVRTLPSHSPVKHPAAVVACTL